MLNKFKELRLTKTEDGFTLLELMIVVVIIGILAAIAIPIFANQQRNAIGAGLKSDVKNTTSQVVMELAKNPTATDVSTLVTPTVSDENTTVTVAGSWDDFTVRAVNQSGNPGCWEYISTTGKFSKCDTPNDPIDEAVEASVCNDPATELFTFTPNYVNYYNPNATATWKAMSNGCIEFISQEQPIIYSPDGEPLTGGTIGWLFQNGQSSGKILLNVKNGVVISARGIWTEGFTPSENNSYFIVYGYDTNVSDFDVHMATVGLRVV